MPWTLILTDSEAPGSLPLACSLRPGPDEPCRYGFCAQDRLDAVGQAVHWLNWTFGLHAARRLAIIDRRGIAATVQPKPRKKPARKEE